MLVEPQTPAPDNNQRAHGNYSWSPRRLAIPPMVMRRDTALNAALQALFPWEHSLDYPGRIKGSVALLSHRVTYWAIRSWRRGTNPTPPWVAETVLAELEQREAALQHAIALIKAHIKKAPD